MQKIKINQNKKALSEMVSYILLVVIALGLAAGVFAWLRSQLPAENEQKCSEDVAITILSYSCDKNNPAKEQITINIKNTGLFNISGIYARGSYDNNKITTEMLDSPTLLGQGGNLEGTVSSGRYNFNPNLPMGLGETKSIIFNYSKLATLESLKKIQIQPFVYQENNLLLCDNVVDLKLEGC